MPYGEVGTETPEHSQLQLTAILRSIGQATVRYPVGGVLSDHLSSKLALVWRRLHLNTAFALGWERRLGFA